MPVANGVVISRRDRREPRGVFSNLQGGRLDRLADASGRHQRSWRHVLMDQSQDDSLPTRLVGFDSEEHGHVLMPAWARRP